MLVYYVEDMKYKDMPYYKEKGGKLRVKKSYKGYQISFLITKSLEDAYETYIEKILSINKIIIEEAKYNNKSKRKIALDNLFILFLDEKELEQKESSIKKKESTFRCHLKAYSKIRCYEWDNDLLKKVNISLKKANQYNVNLHYRSSVLLRDILRFAKKYEYVSPLLNIDLIDIPKRRHERSERVESCYITFEQFNEIVDGESKLESRKYEETAFYLKFLYYTGMRINEARAIRRNDIKSERINGNIILNYILVERQLVDAKNIVIDRLKSDNPKRKVYIKSSIRKMIEEFCDNHNIDGNDYIFDYLKNDKPIIRQRLSTNIKEMINELKKRRLIGDDITSTLSPHGLRYSNTEYLIKILGIDLQIAAEIQGHSVQVMLDIYTRINKKDLSIAFGSKL